MEKITSLVTLEQTGLVRMAGVPSLDEQTACGDGIGGWLPLTEPLVIKHVEGP